MTALSSCSSFMSSSVIFAPVELSGAEDESSEGGGGGGRVIGEAAAAAASGSLELDSEAIILMFLFLWFASVSGVVIGEVFRASGQVRLLWPILWQMLHLRDMFACFS